MSFSWKTEYCNYKTVIHRAISDYKCFFNCLAWIAQGLYISLTDKNDGQSLGLVLKSHLKMNISNDLLIPLWFVARLQNCLAQSPHCQSPASSAVYFERFQSRENLSMEIVPVYRTLETLSNWFVIALPCQEIPLIWKLWREDCPVLISQISFLFISWKAA